MGAPSASALASLAATLVVGCAAMPSVRLNNGVEMPVLAFGANVWGPDTCKRATLDAISAGFRNIWSSEIVGDGCQRAQAEAIKASGVPRSEFFLAGTVETQSCVGESQCYEDTKRHAEGQFSVLGEDVLDMLMLDYPPSSGGCPGIVGQWRALEEIYAAKRVRSIAVSNFKQRELACITANPSATVPAANQMPMHIGGNKDQMLKENADLDIKVQAYSPLAHGKLASDPLCKKIGAAHGKSAAQVALRWITQHEGTICTQSVKPDHIRADADIFSFQLSAEEMRQLDAAGDRL